MVTYFYFLMLAFLITHELDAVKRHEWRVLPLTAFLPEKIGEQVFIWAHVPLLFLIFWYGGFDPNATMARAISAFSVLHVGLHWLFKRHPKYEFNNISSWSLIVGAGIFGTAHLLGSDWAL